MIICITLLLYLAKSESSADFQRGLEAYYKKDYERALSEWKPLVKAGTARAQYYMGILYEHGHGVEKNLQNAVYFYRLAAEQGDVGGQYSMAMAYMRGDGVKRDYVVAHMWAKVAASNGSKGGAKLVSWVLNRMSKTDLKNAKSLLRECKLARFKGRACLPQK